MKSYLSTLEAALYYLDPTHPRPSNAPDQQTTTAQLAAIINAYQAISQPITSIKHLVSLEPEEVENPSLEIEMVTLYEEGDAGIWASGADTGTYVYMSSAVPEDAVEALAIAAARAHYINEGVDFTNITVSTISKYIPAEEEDEGK